MSFDLAQSTARMPGSPGKILSSELFQKTQSVNSALECMHRMLTEEHLLLFRLDRRGKIIGEKNKTKRANNTITSSPYQVSITSAAEGPVREQTFVKPSCKEREIVSYKATFYVILAYHEIYLGG